MGKMKGETKHNIIEALKEKPKPIEELLKLGKRATIYYNIKKLKDEGKIEEIFDEESIVKLAFIDTTKIKIADPDEVNLAIKYLKSDLKEARESAIWDLKELCREKKIMTPDSMKLILKILKKTPDLTLREGLSTVIKWNLQHYLRDISREDYEMIDVLKKGKISNLFIKIAGDNTENSEIREIALEILTLFGEGDRYGIALKILEEEKNDRTYKQISEVVQNIIINQARIKKYEVKRKLYDLLTSEDKFVQKRALDLIDKIRLIGLERKTIEVPPLKFKELESNP